jgi:hypothetical protein
LRDRRKHYKLKDNKCTFPIEDRGIGIGHAPLPLPRVS